MRTTPDIEELGERQTAETTDDARQDTCSSYQGSGREGTGCVNAQRVCNLLAERVDDVDAVDATSFVRAYLCVDIEVSLQEVDNDEVLLCPGFGSGLDVLNACLGILDDAVGVRQLARLGVGLVLVVDDRAIGVNGSLRVIILCWVVIAVPDLWENVPHGKGCERGGIR